MDDDFSQYEAAREAGRDPLGAYHAAKAAGLDPFARIRMLRAVYDLSLLAAKDISVRGDTGQDADTHQATLLPGIEQALDAEDR